MHRLSREQELEEFKITVDLESFIATRGYYRDNLQSSRKYAVMRHANGEKLNIFRGHKGYWRYINVHDDRDQGTVVCFVQSRDKISLGEVRKVLRPWLGQSSGIAASPQRQFAAVVEHEPDVGRAVGEWNRAKPIHGRHPYLEQERGLSPSVLVDPIFVDRIRIDHRDNALFLHHNRSGICGFEKKNKNYTGFSEGGTKGLMVSRPRPTDQLMMICEKGIDLLSHAQMFGTDKKRFFSTAGQVSSAQKELIKRAAKKMPVAPTVHLVADHDQGGFCMIRSVTETLQEIGLSTDRILPCIPEQEGDDWNDVLMKAIVQSAPHPVAV